MRTDLESGIGIRHEGYPLSEYCLVSLELPLRIDQGIITAWMKRNPCDSRSKVFEDS